MQTKVLKYLPNLLRQAMLMLARSLFCSFFRSYTYILIYGYNRLICIYSFRDFAYHTETDALNV